MGFCNGLKKKFYRFQPCVPLKYIGSVHLYVSYTHYDLLYGVYCRKIELLLSCIGTILLTYLPIMIHFKMCPLPEDKWGVSNICRSSSTITCLVVWASACDTASTSAIDRLSEYRNVSKYIEGRNFETTS